VKTGQQCFESQQYKHSLRTNSGSRNGVSESSGSNKSIAVNSKSRENGS
jgi:hypothetical protein